jgi:hypothetical protein
LADGADEKLLAEKFSIAQRCQPQPKEFNHKDHKNRKEETP